MSLTADTTLVLPAWAPFEFERSASFLRRFGPTAGARVCPDGTLVTGGFAPDPFVAHLAPDGPDAVRARVDWLDGPGDGSAVADRLDAFLSLSDDPTPLYDRARTDEAFAPVVASLFGYHHVRFPTPFEAACWAAVSQRTAHAVAARRRDALVRAVGRVASVGDADLSLFPTPAMVSTRPDEVRAAVGRVRAAETMLAAADAFLETDLDDLPTTDLLAELEAVFGFGPWSAAFVALRGFGRASVLPTHETRLRAAVGAVYDLDDPTTDDVERLAEPYGDHRGLWAHYLRVHDSLGSD